MKATISNLMWQTRRFGKIINRICSYLEKPKKFTQTKFLLNKNLHKNSVIHDIFLKTDTGLNSIFTTLNLYKGYSGLGLHLKMNLDDIKDFKSGLENISTD